MVSTRTTSNAGRTQTNSGPTGTYRRRVLAALGAGSAVAVAGCLGSVHDGTGANGEQETGGTDDEAGTTETEGNDAESMIDARFGYTALAGEEATIEADHAVELLIRPREDAPIPEFYFEPTGLFVDPGDTVAFVMATPHHNVNAYHPAFGYEQRVPDGVPPFSSPILAGGDVWYYTFEREGVYDVTCAPHEIFGMAGRIVVGSPTGPGASPVGDGPGGEEARPPEATAATVLSDPALEPEAIVEAAAVSWDDLEPESKRLLVALEHPEGAPHEGHDHDDQEKQDDHDDHDTQDDRDDRD